MILGFALNESRAQIAVRKNTVREFETAPTHPAHEIEYKGWLAEGRTYRATVRYDSSGELEFLIPVRKLEHHAVRVEWTNLGEYPDLKQAANRSHKRIVFQVVSQNIVKVSGQYRWNTTYHCRIEKLL
jgi:hypothetical protein